MEDFNLPWHFILTTYNNQLISLKESSLGKLLWKRNNEKQTKIDNINLKLTELRQHKDDVNNQIESLVKQLKKLGYPYFMVDNGCNGPIITI
jgi:peptidoglycan hydrolase CwlO-like protein